MPFNEEVPWMALWPEGFTRATMGQRLVTSGRLQPYPRGVHMPRVQLPLSSHETPTV